MISLIVSVIVLCCVAAYESVRWLECRLDCEEQRARHQRLLAMPMCGNTNTAIADFERYGGPFSTEHGCEGARRALRLSSTACAIRAFWRESEPYRLYDALASHSPLVLIGALALLLFALSRWFRRPGDVVWEPSPLQRQIYAQYNH